MTSNNNHDGLTCSENKNMEDNNRDNGMITKVWGPPGWLFLHCITFGFPFKIDPSNPDHLQKQKDYRDFFTLIGNVFPCKYCRDSYKLFIKDLPIENSLDSRENLTKWLYDVHNKVNEKLDVPACNIPSFESITKRYEEYRAKCKKTPAEEEAEKKVKGCVIPADGTRRKCVMNIITNRTLDQNEFDNYNLDNTATSNNELTFKINKNTFFYSILIIMLIIFLAMFWKDIKRLI